MHEYRLSAGEYSRSSKEVREVEPAFKIGKVSYYDRLPAEPTERPRQTLYPMSLIGDWVQGYIKENPKENKRVNFVVDQSGLRNQRFGSVEHYAVVEYDENLNLTTYLYDGILQQDGVLDTRTGIATPGSVVAPIEKVEDSYYVHSFWQWRPAAWDREIVVPANLTTPREIEDFKALHTGMWFLSVPGGFAQFVGDTPETVAKMEAMEEAGLKINNPVFDKKSFNRASVASLVNVGFAAFERVGEEVKSEGEILFGSGKMAVRIDQFRTQDAMVDAAVQSATRGLGLISASPVNRQ